jgi:glyoxylase-like metal-dependent hydrolase (beta-lactamase superfamily II)
MNNFKKYVFIGVASLLAACLSTSAMALEVIFQPIAPGIYAFIGSTDGRSYENESLNANIGLVVTPAGAVLIDSGASYLGAKQLAQAVKKITSQPIRWVINTGGQDHRWLGNGYFKAQGAEIIAHANAQPDMLARGLQHIQTNAPVLKEKFDGTERVLPTRWLQGQSTTIEWGGTVFEIIHRNGGHTPGDSMVWLPQSKVVFTGDVVYVQRILGLNDVSKTKSWLTSFEALEALKPEIVVPGHGAVTTLATAQRDTGSLLKALRAHMSKRVADGVDLSAAIKSFDGKPFQHLQHVEVWLPQLANRTYLEVEQE